MHNRQKGITGEDIGCLYVENRGFSVVARNYQKKWGELDIVAKKEGITHFFEVKSVTAVYAARFMNGHTPEENVNRFKMGHISRMIQTYLDEREGSLDVKFHFHVLCVYMDLQTRRARVKWIKNVIL